MENIKQSTDAGRSYGGETPDERVLRRKQQFLDAGLEMFGTVGYRATTVRTLCKQAKLTDRYFYESFSCMEDLLAAVYDRCLDQLQREVMAALGRAQPGDDMAALVRTGLETFFVQVQDPRMARVVWVEILGVSPRIDAMYLSRVNGFANLLLNTIKAVYPTLPLPEEISQIVAVAMIGAVSQSTQGWLLSGYKASLQTMVEATSLLFLGLANTLGWAKS